MTKRDKMLERKARIAEIKLRYYWNKIEVVKEKIKNLHIIEYGDYWEQSATWNNYKVFYKVGNDFKGDWERWEEAPEAVHKHFWNIADYQERCYIENYYYSFED